MKNNKEDLRSLRAQLDGVTKELKFDGKGDQKVPEGLCARAEALSMYAPTSLNNVCKAARTDSRQEICRTLRGMRVYREQE